MTYSTKQLTRALQDLRSPEPQNAAPHSSKTPKVITSDKLKFSQEVEAFLEKKKEYAERTRFISIGYY